MANANLIDRLSGLSSLGSVPQEELEWLVAHGHLEVHEPGAVVAQKGEPVEKLHIVLSGYVTIRVDRGAGPRRVTEWHPGEATGMLPYSRMTGPPGDNYVETRTETLAIHKEHFPLMIQCCPAFTGCTVHMMLDRARDFNSSDLQDEKMISLGKLAAGLAHELNNPASALASGAKQLLGSLADVEAASRALGSAGLTFDSMEQIEQMRAACLTEPAHTGLSPIQKADREDEIADWLARQQSDPVFAASLADTAVTMKELDTLLGVVSGNTLEIALHWIAAGCSTRTLICDMEQAANRIYELVAAVKKFTYMDNLASALEAVLGGKLGDHIRALFCDSIELSGANITDDLFEEFRKRRGYDLKPFVPLVFYHPYEGYTDTLRYDSEFIEDIRRIRYDFNKTLVELFLERFTKTFDDWANEHQMQSRYQAYGMPWLAGMLDGYRMVDIPESNNWLYSANAKSHGYWIWNRSTARSGDMSAWTRLPRV